MLLTYLGSVIMLTGMTIFGTPARAVEASELRLDMEEIFFGTVPPAKGVERWLIDGNFRRVTRAARHEPSDHHGRQPFERGF